MLRRVHTFSYFMSPRDSNRRVRAFERRDDAAAMQLLIPLTAAGFQMGESILNYPPREALARTVRNERLLQVDTSTMTPDDLLLVTTRLPKDDHLDGSAKRVLRGYTDLEKRLFGALERHIDVCSRPKIVLQPETARHLEPGFEDFAAMEFYVRGHGASIKQLNAHDGRGGHPAQPANQTAAFLLRCEAAWEGGPGLLCAFGMDALTTLAWTYRLGHDLRELIDEPGFLVARMITGKPPERPTDLSWIADWEVDVALRVSE